MDILKDYLQINKDKSILKLMSKSLEDNGEPIS